ncbi:cell division protein SepF [Neobacillus vireti]|uniref:Cell division protein SepF n=1 Tax=Neobacillus vireti LMG 21834 TaxID=1131730 RepID=A0AB94IT38_9BACI|nr:cell division protein SepF [Neobacillus vireti]ETI70239.1 cell division machinery factor [Neobacillus vireti LMG 21834]KLT19459.1 cell division protein SepF [Neobacillus vireti]
MTIKSKLKTFFFLDDEYDDNNDDNVEASEPVKQRQQPVKNKNVISLQSVPKSSNSTNSTNLSIGSKVILVEPRSYSESTDIADHLKNRRAVVINLQRIDNEQGRQIIDFISGVVYAIGGDIQKIGLSIFLCTPDNVEVSGNISDLISDHETQNTRW